jgi:hypothetical protein
MIETMKASKIDGFDLYLKIYPDEFAYPEDDEGLTASQVQAYKKDEWWYVYAEIEAHKYGLCLGQAGYGMIEYGLFTVTDQEDHVLEKKDIDIRDINNFVGNELAGEAISQAQEKIKEIREEN